MILPNNPPLYRPLNVAIQAITNKLFPMGFDVSENAPDNLESLTNHINKTGRMLVWAGASENTIYGDREINWAFRAWHDFHHWRHQIGFTIIGESDVCRHQIKDLLTLYGPCLRVSRMAEIITAEIIGQTTYQAWHNGEWPNNQPAFIKAYLRNPGAAVVSNY